MRNVPVPRMLITALLSAGLLSLAFFPADQGWLGWLALVPLLTLVHAEATRWQRYGSAWLAGIAFHAPVLSWMPVADPRMNVTWIALTLYCAAYWPLALALLRRLDPRWPLALTVPIVWVALEFARAHLLTGFAWYFLGHTQHRYLPLIQISDLGGAYAVSLLVAAVNGLLTDYALCVPTVRRWLGLADATSWPSWSVPAVVAGLIVASTGYGLWQLNRAAPETGPRVALLQGNLDQRIRNSEASAPKALIEEYKDLLVRMRRAGLQPDLIVWPETSFVSDWPVFDPEAFPADRRAQLQRWRNNTLASAGEVARGLDAALVLGLSVYELAPTNRERRYNAALFVDRAGDVPGDWYGKIHCVPFGEYVPLRDVLPFMNRFAPYDYDYSVTPGSRFTRFTLTDRAGTPTRFGVVICYEDTDPPLARRYAAPGDDQVDFLVNLSNDGWFDGSSEHAQHLAISRFRAVECRRALVRAVNMGISAVIDADGRIVALPRPVGDDEGLAAEATTWSAATKVSGVVDATVPIDRRMSLYARFGDWLPWACWLVFMVGAWRGVGLGR